MSYQRRTSGRMLLVRAVAKGLGSTRWSGPCWMPVAWARSMMIRSLRSRLDRLAWRSNSLPWVAAPELVTGLPCSSRLERRAVNSSLLEASGLAARIRSMSLTGPPPASSTWLPAPLTAPAATVTGAVSTPTAEPRHPLRPSVAATISTG